MACSGCKRRRKLIIATARKAAGILTIMRRDQRSPEAQAWRPLEKSYRWQQQRKRFLQRNPLCERCKANGQITPATVVHHIKAHKGDLALFWDTRNFEAICAPCHDRDAQSEERIGYGKAIDASGWPIDRRHPANR